jgi:bifunctional non-homologous end joining protein LigD
MNLFWIRRPPPNVYLDLISKAFEFCIPIKSAVVPAGPEWLHKIKHDGFRLRIAREGDRVRLMAAMNWTKTYPWII